MKKFFRAWLVTFGFCMKSVNNESDFLEQNPRELGFAEFYKNKIKPIAAKLEEIRINNLRKIASRGRWVLFLWIILPILYHIETTVSHSTKNITALFILISLILLFSPLLIYTPISRFKKEAEEELFGKIFEFFGKSNYVQQREREDALKDYQRFEILSQFDSDSWITRNYISVNHQNINLNFERLEIDQSSGTVNSTLFNGCAILLNTKTNFDSRTIIIANQFRNWRFVKSYQNKYKMNLQKMDVHEPEFNKLFSIYCEDLFEAKNLITEEFRYQLENLPRTFGSKKVQANLCDNKLLLTLDGVVNLFQFSASVFKPINLTDQCRQIIQQMHLILNVADALNLEQK